MPGLCFPYKPDVKFRIAYWQDQIWLKFYKCGDETSKPHYVTWNPVGTKDPDYHQPEYFGEIIFE